MKILAKTWKDLDFDRMVSDERIGMAIWDAGNNKRNSVSYKKYANSKSKRKILQTELLNGTYAPFKSPDKKVYDARSNKYRTIRRPAFRDQIVHHLLMKELEPYCMKEIIKHNIACIPKRGMGYGKKIMKSWCNHKTDCRWIVQGDVYHYYETASSFVLMRFFKRKIRDKRILNILQLIVDTFTNGFVLGYYVCQWFGALYLSELDHIIKEKFKIKCYVRYVDNIVIGCRTKKLAKQILEFLNEYLDTINLKLKQAGRECTRIFRWAHSFVDFVGTRTYRNGLQTIRRKTYLRIRRLLYRIIRSGHCSLKQARSLLSRRGIVMHSDCYNLFLEMENLIKKMRIRRIVSHAV